MVTRTEIINVYTSCVLVPYSFHGKLTQRYCHLPSVLLEPSGGTDTNELVLADEMGPSDVASVRVVFSKMN